MKKIQYVKLLGLLTVLLLLNISCKDDDTLLRGSGITEQSWSTNQTYFASAEQILTFTFTAQSSWTAQNSSTALLSLDNTAGYSGSCDAMRFISFLSFSNVSVNEMSSFAVSVMISSVFAL